MDIANHVIVAKELKRSETYSGMFQRLTEVDMLEKDLADKLSDMARFRSLLVHQYAEIDNRRVHEILRGNLEDIEAFLRRIEEILEDQ